MTVNVWTQIILYVLVLTGVSVPLGYYMAAVYRGEQNWVSRMLGPVERLIYRLAGIDLAQEMNWKTYAVAMLLFNCVGCLAVYAFQRVQGSLPFNPQGFAAVTPDSSFNTATSFATNTNWQGYAGEWTMSYLTQMAALTVQNFLSAATGMAILVALIRGLTGKETQRLGNFWVDVTRSTLYILMPLSCIFALVLVWQGVPQTVNPYATVTLVQPTNFSNPVLDKDGKPVLDEKGQPRTEDAPLTEQTLALGPVASQEAIKQLGTNGGGFFNANSAHPYENPTPLSNFLEMLSIFLIPAALCFTFGSLVKDMRQGWAIFAAMLIIFFGALISAGWADSTVDDPTRRSRLWRRRFGFVRHDHFCDQDRLHRRIDGGTHAGVPRKED
jgi:K+-transporting ATPase ATPase A chain